MQSTIIRIANSAVECLLDMEETECSHHSGPTILSHRTRSFSTFIAATFLRKIAANSQVYSVTRSSIR